ncbi:MAG: VWA domain-containing protein [Anaerolineae bacterium]|nr:VWA domain-containing protein [Anaerolineae bacterium]NUQ04502.1 VWA domain-containing protein [Anaerolineae bacterium]
MTRKASRSFCHFGSAVLIILLFATACSSGGPSTTLRIVSGSENRPLEPIIQEWARSHNTTVEMTYQGSVDIARLLQNGGASFDGVWPANRLWIDFGDTQNIVRHDASIMRSPVILGVKRSIAESLGWLNRDVTLSNILTAAESDDLRFMMTSATQSNSGASFYFGALNAFAGSPEVVTGAHLEDSAVTEQVERILGEVDRSSGSSGFLKDLFLQQYDRFDAMVNYEAVIIETNQALLRSGREPLYAIYPVDGLTIADSPLGYIDRGEEAKEEAFLALQQHLLSETVQRQLLAQGRRTSLLGIDLSSADRSVFRPEWGIDADRLLQPIRLPSREVIEQALNLYQIALRRPSCTIYVLDFSGSMAERGEADLKAAMRTLLNQSIAQQYFLQGHPGDVTQVILFNENIINQNELSRWRVVGSDPEDLLHLSRQIEAVSSGGNTNIFDSTRLALEEMSRLRTPECLPAVILMTDGQDNSGDRSALERYVDSRENDIPVFAIMFGSADSEQLDPIVARTYGRVFDGRSDLVTAFREAKGYN